MVREGWLPDAIYTLIDKTPLEEGAHPLWDGEDHLPVRHIQKQVARHPVSPCLAALGMARRAKSRDS